MAKKQKSFADKAAGNASSDSVYVKYVKSVQSKDTGRWRFNEQIVRMNKGENLDSALRRMDETANLIDIDLSEFEQKEKIDNSDNQDKELSSANAENNIQADDPANLEEE